MVVIAKYFLKEETAVFYITNLWHLIHWKQIWEPVVYTDDIYGHYLLLSSQLYKVEVQPSEKAYVTVTTDEEEKEGEELKKKTNIY